jgi:hypothetical protein
MHARREVSWEQKVQHGMLLQQYASCHLTVLDGLQVCLLFIAYTHTDIARYSSSCRCRSHCDSKSRQPQSLSWSSVTLSHHSEHRSRVRKTSSSRSPRRSHTACVFSAAQQLQTAQGPPETKSSGCVDLGNRLNTFLGYCYFPPLTVVFLSSQCRFTYLSRQSFSSLTAVFLVSHGSLSRLSRQSFSSLTAVFLVSHGSLSCL